MFYCMFYFTCDRSFTYIAVAGVLVLEDAGRLAVVRLEGDEVGSTAFRLGVDTTIQPTHGHHGQVERRHRRADRQVRVSRQKLDVALIPRHFSLTL